MSVLPTAMVIGVPIVWCSLEHVWFVFLIVRAVQASCLRHALLHILSAKVSHPR